MRQYFTYVNPYIDGAWHPIEYNVEKACGNTWPTFEKNFCVAQGNSVGDSRLLGYVDIPVIDEEGNAAAPSYPSGKYPVEGILGMVLSLFPHVLETVEAAKDKVERWTGRDDITIDGDKVVIPVLDPDLD